VVVSDCDEVNRIPSGLVEGFVFDLPTLFGQLVEQSSRALSGRDKRYVMGAFQNLNVNDRHFNKFFTCLSLTLRTLLTALRPKHEMQESSRVRSYPPQPSHTTVRAVPHTAVQVERWRRSALPRLPEERLSAGPPRVPAGHRTGRGRAGRARRDAYIDCRAVAHLHVPPAFRMGAPPDTAMITLGINAAFHDSAAALVVGGEIIAASEEERFTRIKHGKRPLPFTAWELPYHAIDDCLREAGAELADVHHEAYSFDPRRFVGAARVDLPLGACAAERFAG